jgi:hypothetical protein
MKVLIMKASNLDYEEFLKVRDWNELMKILKKRYNRWIIDFDPSYKRENENVVIWQYDDYFE